MNRKLSSRAAAAAVLSLLALPATGLAASATSTGTISGSTLNVTTTAAPTFTANLDNGDASPTFSIPLTTQDTRGTGAGWNETITSTQYSTGGVTPNTLATTASTITGVAVAAGSGTNTSPTNNLTYPVGVPAALTAPTAVKFFNAGASTGMGKFTVTPTLQVIVPQNAYAGAYSSNITVAIVSGP